MSETGKVSLPTAERIQELKGRYEGLSSEDITFMTVGELTALLAALEETQQQLHDQDEALIAANGLIEDLQIQLEEAQQHNKRLEVKLQSSRDSIYPISVERDKYKVELAEVQKRLNSETYHLKNANYLIEHANKKLEETQQQVNDLKEEKRKVLAVHDEQCVRSSEYYNELIFIKGKMAGAQQTIARKRENERAFLHEVSEIHMEAYAGSNGSLDRADTAIKRIMLLSSNLMARGGETQP